MQLKAQSKYGYSKGIDPKYIGEVLVYQVKYTISLHVGLHGDNKYSSPVFLAIKKINHLWKSVSRTGLTVLLIFFQFLVIQVCKLIGQN